MRAYRRRRFFVGSRNLSGVSDPDKPVQAVVVMAHVFDVTAYFNWALSLVASALFIPFLCRKNPKTDVRLLAVAAYSARGRSGMAGSRAPLR